MLKTTAEVRQEFSSAERRVLSRLASPAKIQDFVDGLRYTLGDRGEPYYSPRNVLLHKSGDCLDGAVFAAAALRFHGQKPLIFFISSVRDDDHVLALFKQGGYWGAISKSKYTGLGYREPIHRDLRELAVSYFESYFNFVSEKTERGYSRPVDLSRFDNLNWMTTDNKIKFIEEYLHTIRVNRMLTSQEAKKLRKVTPLMLEAGELWMRKKGVRDKAAAYLKKRS